MLAGPSGAGKSYWAKKNFSEWIISSDNMREMLVDDASNQTVNAEAFAAVHYFVRERLRLGKSAIVDSTALVPRDRKALLQIAKEEGVAASLIVIDADFETCWRGQKSRRRQVPDHVIEKHQSRLAGMRAAYRNGSLQKEGFNAVYWLKRNLSENTSVRWLSSLQKEIDIIGDVHGCASELITLLEELGYEDSAGYFRHPKGRLAVFLGDLTDRGPTSVEVLEIVVDMVREGSAFIGAIGNHDWKIYRGLVLGRDVSHANGLQTTLDEIEAKGAMSQVQEHLKELFEKAPAYSEFPGKIALAHGALERSMLGKDFSYKRKDPISEIAMFGQTEEAEADERYPTRIYDWIPSWNDDYYFVYGHDVVGSEPRFEGPRNNVIGLDTGCAFGGKLSALRWPEKEIVSVKALHNYSIHKSVDLTSDEAPLTISRKSF